MWKLILQGIFEVLGQLFPLPEKPQSIKDVKATRKRMRIRKRLKRLLEKGKITQEDYDQEIESLDKQGDNV